jgi:hypothetical protein
MTRRKFSSLLLCEYVRAMLGPNCRLAYRRLSYPVCRTRDKPNRCNFKDMIRLRCWRRTTTGDRINWTIQWNPKSRSPKWHPTPLSSFPFLFACMIQCIIDLLRDYVLPLCSDWCPSWRSAPFCSLFRRIAFWFQYLTCRISKPRRLS